MRITAKAGNGALVKKISMIPYVWITFVFVYTCFFAFPQTDDFCTLGRLFNTFGGNPFAETWYLYLNWTGRYTSSFLISSVGWATKYAPWPIYITYSFALAALIIVFYFACNLAISSIAKKADHSIQISAVIYILSLLLMPIKLTGLYWLTGAVVYFASTTLFLLTVAAVNLTLDSDSTKSGRVLVSTVAIAVTVGMNELIAISVGIFLLWKCAIHYGNKCRRKYIALLIATYILSVCTTLFALGNFKRNAVADIPRHDIVQALTLTLQSLGEFYVAHVMPHKLMLGVALIVCFVAGFSWRVLGEMRMRESLALPLTGIVSFPTSLVAYTFLTGESAPGRILNQTYPMLLIGVCLIFVLLGAKLKPRLGLGQNHAVLDVAIFVVGVWFAVSNPMLVMNHMLRSFAPTWRSEQVTRFEQLRAQGVGEVAVLPFSKENSSQRILEGADVTDDPSNWINKCVASYYHLNSVKLLERKQ